MMKIAMVHLTKAIDLTEENPNHLYFANRALVYLDLGLEEECVADCDTVIKMKPDFTKAYWRKAKIYESYLKLDQAMAAI